ncbi:hypothetical protein F5Y10DRAFT_284704 [Nemania abortiva]|nr:hypothetical protein F5Y10DRAFT_284704 [Nemania abortiva]
MEYLGNNIDIILLPGANEDNDAEYGIRPNQLKRTPYQEGYGNQPIVQTTVSGIAHGTLEPDEYPATLLVFEFHLLSMKKGLRFTGCRITILFEDAYKPWNLGPEVWQMSPEGTFALDESAQQRSVKISHNAGFHVAMSTKASIGSAWEMEKVGHEEECMTLSGRRKILGHNSRDDAVVWVMEENSGNKSEIPTFLRGAVLLRCESEEPFSFSIKIGAQVDDDKLGVCNIFGEKKAEWVSPVTRNLLIDPETLRVPPVDPRKVDLSRMDKLDLSDLADVILVTLPA